MAESRIHHVKSDGAAVAVGSVRMRVLFVNRHEPARAHRVASHSHPCWQVEVMHRGRALAQIGGEALSLRPGDALVIPPGVVHAFAYPGPVSLTSIKCELCGVPAALRLDRSAASRAVASLVDRARGVVVGGAAVTMAAAAVAALLAQRSGSPPRTLAGQVTAYIDAHADTPLQVHRLAAHFGYTPRHLAAVFRRATGTPLKRYLDQARAARAAEHLRFADLTVAQVATALGFPDVFNFSRFFRRVTGQTPSACRRASLQ